MLRIIAYQKKVSRTSTFFIGPININTYAAATHQFHFQYSWFRMQVMSNKTTDPAASTIAFKAFYGTKNPAEVDR